MPIDSWERNALENEKRAVERELESVNNEIASLGGGHNEKTWTLQTRRRSVEAHLQTILAKLQLR